MGEQSRKAILRKGDSGSMNRGSAGPQERFPANAAVKSTKGTKGVSRKADDKFVMRAAAKPQDQMPPR